MNIRILTVLIFVLIIVFGLGFFFMNEKNTKDLNARINPTAQEIQAEPDSQIATVRSNDNRVTFAYPSDWQVIDTTAQTPRGKFGIITQSWRIQNTPLVTGTQNAMNDNQAQIRITIQEGGSNLPIDSLLDCSMKTVTCDKIGIDSEQFITSDTVLNNGREIIAVATFYDDKILLGEATIMPGSEQAVLKQVVTTILHSFKFSDNSPVND